MFKNWNNDTFSHKVIVVLQAAGGCDGERSENFENRNVPRAWIAGDPLDFIKWFCRLRIFRNQAIYSHIECGECGECHIEGSLWGILQADFDYDHENPKSTSKRLILQNYFAKTTYILLTEPSCVRSEICTRSGCFWTHDSTWSTERCSVKTLKKINIRVKYGECNVISLWVYDNL